MKILYLFLALISCCIVGCDHGNLSQKNTMLQPTDSILRIEINSESSPVTRNLRYFKEQGVEYLALQGHVNDVISILDITNRSFCKNIKPIKEGPNGLNSSMSGFDMLNFDSIFISTKGMCNNLFLIDSSATIKKKIEFEILLNPYIPLQTLWSSYSRNINKKDNLIFILNVFRAQREYWPKRSNYTIGYRYDFSTDKQEKHPLTHPMEAEGDDQILVGSNIMCIDDGDKVILSYTLGHQIFVSENYSEWKSYDCRSRYIDHPFQTKLNIGDIIEGVREYIQTSSYLALVYDKYRDVYYRFVYPGIDVKSDDDVMKLSEFRRVFSIMIIDKDFNVIGETLMPESTYNSNMFFINEAGLWLSTNHPDNPKFEEDAINFQLFTLK